MGALTIVLAVLTRSERHTSGVGEMRLGWRSAGTNPDADLSNWKCYKNYEGAQKQQEAEEQNGALHAGRREVRCQPSKEENGRQHDRHHCVAIDMRICLTGLTEFPVRFLIQSVCFLSQARTIFLHTKRTRGS